MEPEMVYGFLWFGDNEERNIPIPMDADFVTTSEPVIECHPSYDKTFEMSMTLKNPIVNIEVFNKMTEQTMPQELKIYYPTMVQVRKHHKKRINKKWLKKYGCKEVMKIMNGWKLQSYTNGLYEFVKEIGESNDY